MILSDSNIFTASIASFEHIFAHQVDSFRSQF